jgi:Haem-binding domain
VNRLARYLLPVATVVLAMQAVRYPSTNPQVERDLVAPPDVKAALHGACYDCHSNETAWPWYTAVAPASWIIHRDVDEGRKRLNFSSWGDYADDPGTLSQKLDEIAKAVAAGDMAPWYYRMLHPDARLSETQRESLVRWAKQTRASATASAH